MAHVTLLLGLFRPSVWLVRLCNVALIVGASPTMALAADVREAALEPAVKASYLFKFAPFITWPDRAFSGPSQPFMICVVGEDPFESVLDEVVRGQRMGGHPVAVRRLGKSPSVGACHILYAGKSAQAGDYLPFQGLSGQAVLTVTDTSTGISGAMIRFVKLGGRVRFQIDAAAAKASGLVVSSKLLGLAISADKQ